MTKTIVVSAISGVIAAIITMVVLNGMTAPQPVPTETPVLKIAEPAVETVVTEPVVLAETEPIAEASETENTTAENDPVTELQDAEESAEPTDPVLQEPIIAPEIEVVPEESEALISEEDNTDNSALVVQNEDPLEEEEDESALEGDLEYVSTIESEPAGAEEDFDPEAQQ